MRRAAILIAILAAGCATSAPEPPPLPIPADVASVKPAVAPDIEKRLAQMPRTPIDYDRSLLTDSERAVVAELIEASKVIDKIFWLQVSERSAEWDAALAAAAATSPRHAAARQYFHLMKGPWDDLAENEPFVEGVGPKPEGAGFYPPDITKDEIERWIAAHPEEAERVRGLFTVIRRSGDNLAAIPYSIYYSALLTTSGARSIFRTMRLSRIT
jgi:hypothetical protein